VVQNYVDVAEQALLERRVPDQHDGVGVVGAVRAVQHLHVGDRGEGGPADRFGISQVFQIGAQNRASVPAVQEGISSN